jgi:D-beta-D-heptose 7-phosphate kinase/D-beta-D-heptose 1-phosphate adenosyltransferase
MKALTQLIKELPNTKLIVIGDLMLDVFIYGSVDRISPEAPVPVVKVVKEQVMPGGAANVAANLASLGATPTLIGVASDDDSGRNLKKLLRSMNINTKYFDDGRNTIVKTRIIAHSQQVVRFDKENKDKLSKNISSDIINYVTEIIDNYDGIILSDYGKGVITEYLIKNLTALCRGKNKIITVDPKVENFKLYKNVTSITPNNKEASQAMGIPINDEKSLLKCGNKIIEILECDSVLLTSGPEGMSLFIKNDETKNIPAVAKEVFDVTGAGDTVISVFSAAISLGATLKQAAVLANTAAGIVVGKIGTATVSLEELESNLPYSVKVMGVV